jgi:hypothetical protein
MVAAENPFKSVTPLEPLCPWADWARPNLKWCEDNLCAWITAPANTWSNVLYIVFGLLMMREARRLRSPTLALFGPASIITGLCSFLFHASYTYFFQVWDYFGMFVFVYLPVIVNALRLGWISKASLRQVYALAVVLTTAAVPLMARYNLPYQSLVAVLVVLVGFQEYRLRIIATLKGEHVVPQYKEFAVALAFIGAGFICSMADASRIWCKPDNHLVNGHACWHVLTSIGLFALFKHYCQFAWDKGMLFDKGARGLPVMVV